MPERVPRELALSTGQYVCEEVTLKKKKKLYFV